MTDAAFPGTYTCVRRVMQSSSTARGVAQAVNAGRDTRQHDKETQRSIYTSANKRCVHSEVSSASLILVQPTLFHASLALIQPTRFLASLALARPTLSHLTHPVLYCERLQILGLQSSSAILTSSSTLQAVCIVEDCMERHSAPFHSIIPMSTHDAPTLSYNQVHIL